MNEELEFNKPKMWYFTGHTPHIVQPTAANKMTAPQRQLRPKSVGIIALSFDRAYTKVRECMPDFRINNVQMADANVDLIVDDPVAYKIAKQLSD